jgi:hypothetical protein
VPPPGFVPPPSTGGGTPAPSDPPTETVGAGSRRFRPHHVIAAGIGLVAAAAAVFVVFAATNSQSVDPIAQAASVSSDASGYRMNLGFTITSSQLGGPISASGSAVVDPPDHAASMSLDMDLSQEPQAVAALGSSTMRLGMVLVGQDLYVRLPQAIVGHLPSLGGKPWVEENLGHAIGLPGLSSLGSDPGTSDPGAILKELRAGADSVTDEGQQRVDGVQTTHYWGELSFEPLLGNLPAADRAVVQQLTQGQGVPIDVWIDAHDLVRRVVMSLTLNAPDGVSLQETATTDITDYGPQPRPMAPPPDQVTDGSSISTGLPS